MTCINCSNCNKELKRGEKEIAEKQGHGECAECQFHEANGTRTIKQFNKWLRSPMSNEMNIDPIEINDFFEQFIDDPVNEMVLDSGTPQDLRREVYRDAIDYFGRCTPDLLTILVDTVKQRI